MKRLANILKYANTFIWQGFGDKETLIIAGRHAKLVNYIGKKFENSNKICVPQLVSYSFVHAPFHINFQEQDEPVQRYQQPAVHPENLTDKNHQSDHAQRKDQPP